MAFYLFIIAAAVALLSSSSHGFLTPEGKPIVKAPKGATTTGHHIVVLKKDSSEADLHNVMEKVKRMAEDVAVHRYTEHVGKTLTVDAPKHVLDKILLLNEVNHIEEEDLALGAECTKIKLNDTNFGCPDEEDTSVLWFLDRLNQPNLPLDGLPVGDNFNVKEEETVDVYVLDSGIAYEHSEFENRAKYAGFDPVDDYHYTTLNTPDYVPQNGRDCNGHGTLVASLIGGKTYGIAKKVNMYSVRVLGCERSAPWSVVLDGLNFIATTVVNRKRPAIVTMALSGSIHTSLNSAIKTLHDQNVLIVGSVGNTHTNSCISSPANNELVLRVGATNINDTIYEYSNIDECVDIFAPGERISGASMSCPTCRSVKNGTSLASALVTGIAAVHLSRSPFLNAALLKRTIIDMSSKDVLKSMPSSTVNRMAKFDYGGSVMINENEILKIKSPNFPSHYNNSVKCTWILYVPEGYHVSLAFEFIKVEEKYDSVKVCDGATCSNVAPIIELSGDYAEVNCGCSSSKNVLTVEFISDETTTSSGFQASARLLRSEPTLEECHKPNTTRALQIDTVSQGINVGNRFLIQKDWKQIFGGRRTGINMAIIDEISGEVIETTNYDTYLSSSHSLNLAYRIEQLHPGALVALSSSGNSIRYFGTRAKRAISTLGSQYSYSMNGASSWSLVGVKGLAHGKAIESHSLTHAVNVSTQFKLQQNKMFGLRIEVISGGKVSGGDMAYISIDGRQIKIVSDDSNNIGLNVAVFDENSGKILDTIVFNTHAEAASDHTPSDAFAEFIDALPRGRIVAIAIRGDAITHLTERAIKACEKIGSKLIRHVQIDRSWAIIGKKNALPGEVAESVKYNARAFATAFLPIGKSKNSSFCKISAASSSRYTQCGSPGLLGAHISINHQTYPSSLCPSYGIIVGLVDETSCDFEQTVYYNTHSSSSEHNQLRSFIDSIPDGRIVVAAIAYDGYRYLYDNGRQALGSIGSAHIWSIVTYDAWAIIGRKGAAPGSVPEVYNNGQWSAAVSATVPISAPELPTLQDCDNSIYPLSCRAGMNV